MFENVAEEYCNEMMCTVCSNIICGYKGKCTEWETRKRTFLAGLKAGKPQWHDLREDPNDLPEDTYDVLDQAGYKVHYNFFQNVWMNEKDEIDEHVIAWCEIPTYDKK